jgi:mannose-1-phosphate guanylyltransferase
MHNQIADHTNQVALILAGGEGTRLAELTKRADGVRVPKQFCSLIGNASLLEQTRHRVELSVPSQRVFFALSGSHENLFSPLLADVPRENLIVQPSSRGTAPAILYSLFRLAESFPRASVLLMPSDHYVADEATLMKQSTLPSKQSRNIRAAPSCSVSPPMSLKLITVGLNQGVV